MGNRPRTPIFYSVSPMNNENLRPFNVLSPEEHRKVSRMGGIASGQARARKAYMKAVAREMILRSVYFSEAEEELEQEWNEFQRWRRRQRRKKPK